MFFTYPTSGEEPWRLSDEPIDEALTPLPVVDGHTVDVANVAESCQRAVQEHCE